VTCILFWLRQKPGCGQKKLSILEQIATVQPVKLLVTPKIIHATLGAHMLGLLYYLYLNELDCLTYCYIFTKHIDWTDHYAPQLLQYIELYINSRYEDVLLR
jgi:hypothetical protein